jgi:homogentisate 1,2-dioxygenase
MLHRLQQGQVPAKPHTVFKLNNTLLYEHCFTRQGFDGPYSILYHKTPPHPLESETVLGLHPGFAQPENPAPLRRRHFRTAQLTTSPPGSDSSPFMSRKRLLANADVAIWFSVAEQSDPELVCNADGDELVYVYQGSGTVETPFGKLPFKAEDYVYLPKSVIHRWVLNEPARFLIIEGLSSIDIPAYFRNPAGQLRMDAAYTHRDFQTPQWSDSTWSGPADVLIKRQEQLTRLSYKHHPFDVVGWDGALWPFVFPIRAFQPRTGLVHLPPSIHTTFTGPGFVICSFVPRVTDFHPDAIPCPYPHSSPDCDEFLFYVAGNFTSRRGIDSGSVSFHPMGLPHGPHPGAYEASIGTVRTDELAVMVDTFKPLMPTAHAYGIEDTGYQMSWKAQS